LARKRKPPAGCYWREGVLWGRTVIRGREYRWSLRTGDPADARQRFKAAKERLTAEAFHRDGIKRTLADAIERWPAHLDNRDVGANARKRYAVSMGQLLPHLDGGRLPLTDIKAAKIREVVHARRARGAINATLKRDLVALSSVMNCAIAEGWIEANPVLPQLKDIKEKRNPIVLPERRQVDLVIERAPGMIRDLIEIAVRTGAREDELLQLRRPDIDHDRRQMTLQRIGTGGPKGGKTRVVDLDPFGGYDHVRALPAYAGSQLVFWHSAGQGYRNFASQFSAIVKRTAAWAAEHGVEFRPFRFHDLRHYHAVQWLKSGRDIYDLQKRLGHSSIKVTEEYCRYLTKDEEHVVKFGRAASR
jgi:integrase/recombinase XerD